MKGFAGFILEWTDPGDSMDPGQNGMRDSAVGWSRARKTMRERARIQRKRRPSDPQSRSDAAPLNDSIGLSLPGSWHGLTPFYFKPRKFNRVNAMTLRNGHPKKPT